jgi:hypothetical protein
MKRTLLFAIILLFTVSLTACNFPIGGSTGESESAAQTAIALNVALTQFAATQTAAVPPVVEPSATVAMPTSEPYTPTPSMTAEPTATPTQGGVWLTVQENTNCRSGPGSMFSFMGLINAGQQVEAVGRSTINDYFYIKNPTNYSDYCWLWSRYSTVAGDTSILPVFTPQPTPTPAVTPTNTKAPEDFSVKYLDTQKCDPFYGIQLYVVNTGSTTWQSIRVTLVDNTASKTYTHKNNLFFGTDGCVKDVTNAQGDLTTGESSRVALVDDGEFNYNPSGHSFTATVIMYSADGNLGTSVTRTINFTP